LRNKPIPKAIIAAFALNNLTSEYSPIIAAITTKYRDNDDDDDIDLDDLFNAIIDESRRLKISEIKESKDVLVLTIKNNDKKRSLIKCYKCGKRGHLAKKCWSKSSDDDNSEMALNAIEL
jgi:Zinc knuckle